MKKYQYYVLIIFAGICFTSKARYLENDDSAWQASSKLPSIVSSHSNTTPSKSANRYAVGSRIKYASDPIISHYRPRLFVRSDHASIGRCLTLSELRSRVNDPAYSEWIHYDGKVDGWQSLPAIAMQYLLTGNKKDALTAGEFIANTSFSFDEHTSAAAMVYNSAIAFDWVRNSLPHEMVRVIIAKLIDGAEHLKEGVANPAINHNYTIVSLHAVAMVAIAVYGESEQTDEKAYEYLELVQNLLLSDHLLFDTFREKQGTWTEGNHYTPFVVFHPFLMTLRGLTTATDTDYFQLIRDEYGDFLEPMSQFLIANFRPDFTLERTGDVTGRVVPHKTFIRPLIELLASEIKNPDVQGQTRSFSKEMADYYGKDLVHDVYKWMMLVTYDSQLPDKRSYKTLPLAMRLGKNSYEHIMFRNSWEEDATLITFISGDHFTDHQHFDKGNFLIYKRGALTVDAGGYSGMYGNSWSNYSVRSLAHNSVLVFDPSEVAVKGVEGTKIYPDGGQRIIRGVQSVKSWQEYKEESKKYVLNTAEVLAFDADGQSNRYDYVKSNLTNAYGKNILWMDRQLLYVPGADYLLVKDRVATSKPLAKYWLMHFQERPEVDGKVPAPGVNDYPDAHVVHSTRTGELALEGKAVSYTGSLFIKTLLPPDRNISVIGGPGYEYFNRFVNMNFPPEKPFGENREAGNWRMEVSSRHPGTATAFLHAFEISGVNRRSMVATQYIRSEDGKMDGALFLPEGNGYLVFFSSSLDSRGHDFQTARLPLNYKIDVQAPVTHILAELEPSKKLKVYVNKRDLGSFQTSDAGVLIFKDTISGMRTIEIKSE